MSISPRIARKVVIDFAPFIKSIEQVRESMGLLTTRWKAKRTITTSKAPSLGPSTDI